MPSELYLYDSSLSPLPSTVTTVSVTVSDRSGTVLATPAVRSLAAGFGASYVQAGQHDVYVRDRSGTYSSTHVIQLNGNQSYRVDLVLLPPPITVGSGRASLTNPRALRVYLARQVGSGLWTELQAAAVVSAVALVNYARTRPTPDLALNALIDDVVADLRKIGIKDEED